MAGAGNGGASTGPHTTAYGRMTLTPTGQPESKQKMRDSDSDSFESASFPSSESPSLQARKKPESNRFAGLWSALLGLVTEIHAKNETLKERQLQSAGNARCRLPPKGRGRGRAQPPNMAGAGNGGASTGPPTTAYGRMTLTPTEQPGSKQKMRDSDSDSLQSALFPSSESPSLQARKKPESNRFAGLQGALLGIVTEVHAKNETLKKGQSALFSGHVQVMSKPNRTPTEQPGHNQT